MPRFGFHFCGAILQCFQITFYTYNTFTCSKVAFSGKRTLLFRSVQYGYWRLFVMCGSCVNYFTLVNEWSTSHFENEVLHSLNYALNAHSARLSTSSSSFSSSSHFVCYFSSEVTENGKKLMNIEYRCEMRRCIVFYILHVP